LILADPRRSAAVESEGGQLPAFFLEAMQAAAITPVRSPVETEVLRIRGLIERNQFAAALSAAEVLAVKVPENRDVLYMIAVSHRYLNRIPDALATLEGSGAAGVTFDGSESQVPSRKTIAIVSCRSTPLRERAIPQRL
jgi:hypothetical protein